MPACLSTLLNWQCLSLEVGDKLAVWNLDIKPLYCLDFQVECMM